jgi:predicted acylesterase/phospholipase RssA
MSGKKFDFNNLEYIVMEGGGARGVAYLGAIRALESKMSKRQNVQVIPNLSNRDPGLLDYYNKDGNTEIPAIKGIAGSSAGAITTFALALGFNSTEIDSILKFPFKEFLKEKNVGKYRMIDENGFLAIGEDKKNKTTKAIELNKDDSTFEFNLGKKKTEIGNNIQKLVIRNAYFTILTRVVTDGFGANLKNFKKLSDNLNKIPEELNMPKILRGILRFILRFIPDFGMQKVVNALILKGISHFFKMPFKIDGDIVMNAFFDRGMYSGFAVREFFLDMVILAATKDTKFQRGFIKFLEAEKKVPQSEIIILKDELSKIKNFKIGSRHESKLDKKTYFIKYFEHIKNLTFDDFYKISGVDFGLCISNFSSGFPLYFGYEWTPHFRVMEAVGASMSIPPAFKPLYNASDVVKDDIIKKSIIVKTTNGPIEFVKNNGQFELSDYYFFEHLVKKAIVNELSKPDENDSSVFINPNNSIDLSTFLPKLKELAYGYFDVKSNKWIPSNKNYSTTVSVNKNIYTIDYPLLLFFYNAMYKGLFLDGGYRNNIPYNFFRLRNKNIDTVFAIKLDNSFPPEVLKNVYDKINKYLKNIDTSKYIMQYDFEEFEGSDNLVKLISTFVDDLDPKEKVIKQDIINQTQAVFDNYLFKWVSDPNIDEKTKRLRINAANESKKNPKIIKRLALSTIKQYRKHHLTAPWAIPKSILRTALEGYEYGSEKEQVKEIADHNQILPLYDCGIGVYDFELDNVKPMVILAQALAEIDTLDFFKSTP